MENLVSSEEETFEMESGKYMVYPGHPLGHSHVICVFRFKQEFEESPGGCPQEASPFSRQSTVSWDPEEGPVSISNQPERILVAGEGRRGRSKHGSNQIIVEERRPQGELCLLQREYA